MKAMAFFRIAVMSALRSSVSDFFIDLIQCDFRKLFQINTLVPSEFELVDKAGECFHLWQQHDIEAVKTRFPIRADLVAVAQDITKCMLLFSTKGTTP